MANEPIAGNVAADGKALAWRWGLLPALFLVMGLGLFVVAVSDTLARRGVPIAETLFWAGLLILFTPVLVRLLSVRPSRSERIGLLTGLGLALYLVKVLHSPVGFTFHDEFVTWRSTQDIMQTGHLFDRNPLLPIGSLYPGLAIVAAALAELTGLPVFAVALILIGAIRVVLILALYLFYDRVSGSPIVAGLATIIYMANPNFVFFDAQFSYESLAVPFGALALFAAAAREDLSARMRMALSVTVVATLTVVVFTHHLTTYALAAFLALWAGVFLLRWRHEGHQVAPAGTAVLAWVIAIAWLAYAASLTVGYLAPHLTGATQELFRMIAGEATGRQLFRSFRGGLVSPVWERTTAFAAVVFILGALPLGLVTLRRRRHPSALAVALGIAALAYPITLVFRLTNSGAEAANRANEFLFLAIAFVLAMGVGEKWLARELGWKGKAVVGSWATVIFVGGVIVGFAPWSRLPEPYLVGSDTRSIEPQGIDAALWTRSFLGPDNRVATDRTNSLLLGSYGGQHPVTGYADHIEAALLFFSPLWSPSDRLLITRGQIRYLVVDNRLTEGLPSTGVYYEAGEPASFEHQQPMDPAGLAKFEGILGISRIYDSGDIIIYDVGRLSHGQ